MVETIPCRKPVITRGRTLDHVASVYDILSPLMTFGVEGRISKQIINRMSLPVSARVLDIGCGTGSLAIQISQKKLFETQDFIIGVDAADRMLEVARKKSRELSNIRFDHAVAENLPYEENSFDSAVSAFFFHHVDMELKEKALAEAYRVLKPFSRFFIVDVCKPTSIFGRLCAWSGYWLFQQDEIKENIQGLLEEAIARSSFSRWKKVSHHLGYIGVYELVK